MKSLSIFLLCLLLNFSFCEAQSFNKAKADSLFDLLQNKNKAMGSVCIQKNGKVLYQRAFGWTEARAHVRNNDSTAFRIGSITKVFTSVLIHQMLEKHALELETKVSTFFPDLKNIQGVTIANLLDHSSGIHNFTDDSTYGNYFTQFHTHDEMLEIIGGNAPDFSPGTKHAYSNSNFVLLGYIVEQLSSSDYATQVKDKIVKPLGLRHTYAFKSLGTSPNEARSYEFDGSEWKAVPETDWSIPQGAGVISSSPKELCIFIESLMQGKLIPQKELTHLLEIHDGYGSGIFQIPFGKRKAFGHTGGIDNFRSVVAYFPDDSTSFACSFNGLDFEMNDILIGLLSIYYNIPYKLMDFKVPEVYFTPEEIKNYPGTYACNGFLMDINIRESNGKFFAQAKGQSEFPLTAMSNTEFRFETAGIVIIFKAIQDKPGNFSFTLKQAGQQFEFFKKP